MGDRANIVLLDDFNRGKHKAQGVYLYAHWDGPRLAAAALEALASDTAKRRYGDGSYLGRIVIQRTLAALGADPDEDTGYGIATAIGDNSYNVLAIDMRSQTVRVMAEGTERVIDGTAETIAGATFADIAAEPDVRAAIVRAVQYGPA